MIRDYVAFDLETTGLAVETDEIIEIGALKVISGKVVERFSTLVHPKKPVSFEISQITGITNEMLESAPWPDEVIPKFLDFCGDEILLGHNIMFDYKFTKTYAKKYGLPFEKKGIDTLKIARKLLPELPSRSLTALCEHYDIINASAHRAYHDALATAKLYQTLVHYYGEAEAAVFEPANLEYRPKKPQPATDKQKKFLKSLIQGHNLKMDVDMDGMTKSEMSRVIDRITLQYGRLASEKR